MRFREAKRLPGFRAPIRSLAIRDQWVGVAVGQAIVFCGLPQLKAEKHHTLNLPTLSLAISPTGDLWTGHPDQIQIHDQTGKLKNTWTNTGDVTAIAFYKDYVLAADVRDRSINRYDRTGKLINKIGKDNKVRGFLIPNGVLDFAIDPAGIIHAANPGKHRVERYTLEGQLLGHVGHFDGVNPEGFPGCCNPTNIALHNQNIYVTEKAGARAKVLSPTGELLAVIADQAFDPNCKNIPIAVDPKGRVYVADTVKLEILVFEAES